MNDPQAVSSLKSALQFAEATLLKMEPKNAEQARWKADAIERIGKTLAEVEFRRVA